ncbi:glutamine--fructose-6-phosphate transaminase (isomerizing) [Xanthomonas translucens]|uniref:Glutamine--fructose-6-phosphate aminotransferase [isomerizing] n=1 Tax=Xanthomonas translucens pv. translucens DSM 18974 TaxID=1261556 RepID=A0A1C3TST6_XANCT|nr:glutamine--fructose-6-phosphate transaminase (isomerizing) [Xanthomonas translucens]MCC8447294.1 glutamine--fructose-6-phosphate transaminase (isomerizing) [Xanthomonas translucens pv. translucens]CCP39442.1 glucosamine--fructose-6-phosphateaminotransferase [Xanthomonas translucens pv. translucens DSM 18974]SCB06263.1 glutamine-fructose-6-phosphate transaminase (isomerizing) [Xanthomonas translucens pv. translucens DSM 18974]
MCGIVGAIAERDVVPVLIEGLKRLEYRGYDSSGIAVVAADGVRRVRRTGRVAEMEGAALAEDLHATLGIGHTRWATHGGVTEANAHPHVSHGDLALVHNGIIENHEQQRERLRALGYVFESQTDTEVIAHLIHHHAAQGLSLLAALQAAAKELTGAYALAAVSKSRPDVLVCARMGCPLLVGLGEGENFIASDVSAVIQATRRVIFLEEGDTAELSRSGVQVYDAEDRPAQREVHMSEVSLASLELGPYRHFMQKEIHEQPRALADTLEALFDACGFDTTLFGRNAEMLADIDGVQILACGTSYYAGLTARYWIEAIAGLPCSVEIASEYRYRAAYANPRQLIVTISQSGETLDTMEALKYAKSLGHAKTLSICNVPESAIPRASALVLYTRAGAEIGVASTKAFTTQLAALFQLTCVLAKLRGRLSAAQEAESLEQLRYLPGSVQHALNLEPQIAVWAERFADKRNALFLGRGLHYPIALEGALKLKEITYIHAEGYPAGELKHGPLALVDAAMPVVVIAPNDALLEKVKSNMQEVRARGGELFVFADQDSRFSESDGVHVIRTPRNAGLLSPVVHTIPVQLLAYHTALARGTDLDKPRNLAKSVTVE